MATCTLNSFLEEKDRICRHEQDNMVGVGGDRLRLKTTTDPPVMGECSEPGTSERLMSAAD